MRMRPSVIRRFTPSYYAVPTADPGSAAARQILTVTQQDVRDDCSDLAISMAELAQGDLTRRLVVRSRPVDPTQYPGMAELVDVINSVISSLKEAASGFNELTEEPSRRLCYVGADSFVEGCACGEAMGEALGGSGEVAVVTTYFTVSGPELRRKGFMSVIHDRFPGIQVVKVIEGTESRVEAYQRTADLLREHPRLRGVYVTVGATPHEVAKAVTDAGKAEQIRIITHDVVAETIDDIRLGTITATLGQDPFAQGWEPVIHLFNHLSTAWCPAAPRLLTHRDLITRENWKDFWDDRMGIIESAAVSERRTQPIDTLPPHPLRIAVIGREDAKFWEPVRAGVLAAADKLRSYNTTVEWVVPNPDGDRGFISSEAHGGLIDRLVEQGYHGIATAVFSNEYIPYINRAVEAGVAVVTYNTEPISLRGLVAVVIEQAERLLQYSQQLSTTIGSVSQATHQINLAMNQVARGTTSQNDHVARTHEFLSTLLEQLEEVTQEATQGAKAAEEAARAAEAGDMAVTKTHASMQGIESAVSETARTVQALDQESQKIDAIVKLISTIAYQVKLLGINAAIEAAHAGRYGAGFLVVAGEIRSLADRTTAASREVTELIESVKNRIREVQRVMGATRERVNQGGLLAEEAGRVLADVHRAVAANLTRLAAITSRMSEMQHCSERVGEAMESVAAVSEENAGAVEEVTASTEEMSGQLEEVASLARALASMADTTRELLAKFRTASQAA